MYTVEQMLREGDRAALAALTDTEPTPTLDLPEFVHGRRTVETVVTIAPGIAVVTSRTIITSRTK